VHAGALPAKLNAVVQPLMGALRREAEPALRRAAAAGLAELVALCCGRQPTPNDRRGRRAAAPTRPALGLLLRTWALAMQSECVCERPPAPACAIDAAPLACSPQAGLEHRAQGAYLAQGAYPACAGQALVPRRVVKNLCAMACGDPLETPSAALPDVPEDEPDQAAPTAAAAAGAGDPAAAAACVARQARPPWSRQRLVLWRCWIK